MAQFELLLRQQGASGRLLLRPRQSASVSTYPTKAKQRLTRCCLYGTNLMSRTERGEHAFLMGAPVAEPAMDNGEESAVGPVLASLNLLEPLPAHKPADGFYSGAYRVHMEVRPTEVDQFNVVNNTVYAEYLLFVRAKFMEALGMSPDRLQQELGMLCATIKLDLTFHGPLRPGDRFYAECALTRLGNTCGVFEERIVRLPREPGEEPKLMVECEATCVFLNAQYKTIRVPSEFKALLKQAMSVYTEHGSVQPGAPAQQHVSAR